MAGPYLNDVNSKIIRLFIESDETTCMNYHGVVGEVVVEIVGEAGSAGVGAAVGVV